MKFNVNDKVRVQLTPYGISCMETEWKRVMPSSYPFKMPKIDSEGWSEFQMHDLMLTFGKYMFMGNNLPFKTTIDLMGDDD